MPLSWIPDPQSAHLKIRTHSLLTTFMHKYLDILYFSLLSYTLPLYLRVDVRVEKSMTKETVRDFTETGIREFAVTNPVCCLHSECDSTIPGS